MLFNMSESTYVVSSYEGCKKREILSIEYEEKILKRDLKHNSENYEGVKYLIERVY